LLKVAHRLLNNLADRIKLLLTQFSTFTAKPQTREKQPTKPATAQKGRQRLDYKFDVHRLSPWGAD